MWTLKKSLLILLILFLGINLLQKPLSAGQCLETEILKSSQFQTCLSQLEKCSNANDDLSEKLGRCKVDAKEDKVLFFFDAESIAYFGIGLLFGVIIL